MIIDIHGHYTTAPAQLGAWRDLQIAFAEGRGEAPDPAALRSALVTLARQPARKATASGSSTHTLRQRRVKQGVEARRSSGMR